MELFSERTQYVGDVDDASLLRRACKGDEVAFGQLFTRYERRIFQYASRMCGSGTGDDVVQDTFLAILNGKFDPSKGSVAGYLFGIARHHVIRRLEKRGVGMRIESDPRSLLIGTPTEAPIDAMAREQLIEAVRKAVEDLPPVYREVVVLCELEEMNYATVAEVIQCPIGTVRSRLHRARGLLLSDLSKDIGQPAQTRKHG